MGIRSILRRVRKPAVMAVVAGTLALSLTVTTTQKAEASPVAVLPVIAAAEAVVGGASLPLVLPSVLATSLALHPVGWAIAGGVAVAGLAIGAYYTRDYWLPYLTGDFGGAKDKTTQTPGSGTQLSRHKVDSYTRSGNAFTVTYSYGGGGSTTAWYAQFGVIAKCKRTTDGFISYASKNGWFSRSSGSVATAAWSQAVTVTPCLTGWDTVAWKIGGGGSTYAEGGTWTPSLNTGGTAASFEGSGQYQFGSSNVISGGDFGTPTFNPNGSDVKYKTTSECISDGGVKSTISAEWLGSDGGAKFPSCAAAGKGHGTGVNKIEGYAPAAPGQVGTQPETIWETTAPAVDPNYSKCGPERPGSGCKMAITIDGKPCVIGQWECENWTEIWKDPETTARVGCTYGPYTLAVDMCIIMEPAYRPGGAPATEANADGNPETRNNVDLSGEPFTPENTGTAPVPGGSAAGAPAGSTPEQAQCFPSGWGMLNPVEWVMKPVNCALDAAFKPKKDVQTRLTSMQSQFSNKVPISWFGGNTTNVSGGACPTSWAFEISGQHVSLICGTPVEGIILAFRPVLGAMLVIAALWPLVRSLFYAAIPILKVNPS